MAQYFYSENGQPVGPFSAQQLKDFAQAGRIRPETLVWKEGAPQWAPASSYKGLLPSRTANGFSTEPPRPRTLTPSRPSRAPSRKKEAAASKTGLWITLGSIAAGLAILAVLLVLLLNSGGKDKGDDSGLVNKNGSGTGQGEGTGTGEAGTEKGTKAGTESAQEKAKPKKTAIDDEPPPEDDKKTQTGGPAKVVEKPQAVELNVLVLLDKYKADPAQTLKEYGDKRITLQIEGKWTVDDLKKAIGPNGNLEIYFHTNRGGLVGFTHNNVVFLTFPDVNPKSKLGFFAKIKEYAEKWKKGDNVAIRVNGLLATSPKPADPNFKDGTYLHLKDAELLSANEPSKPR